MDYTSLVPPRQGPNTCGDKFRLVSLNPWSDGMCERLIEYDLSRQRWRQTEPISTREASPKFVRPLYLWIFAVQIRWFMNNSAFGPYV